MYYSTFSLGLHDGFQIFRRTVPLGLPPTPNSQTGGTPAIGRLPPRITKRLPRLLPANRSRRLPATALLQRRCGSAADCHLNSAFAVPERVELGSNSRGGGKRTARRKVSKGKNRGFFPLVHLFWYFSRCMTRKVHIKPFCCPFLSLSRERDRKSATKGENPRFSPLETAFLFCAHFRSAKMFTRCQVGTSSVTRNGVGATPVAVNLLGCNRTLIAKRLARLPSADHLPP